MWRAPSLLLALVTGLAAAQPAPGTPPVLRIDEIRLDSACRPVIRLSHPGPTALSRADYHPRRGFILLLQLPRQRLQIPLAELDPQHHLQAPGGRLEHTVDAPLPPGEHRLLATLKPHGSRMQRRLHCPPPPQGDGIDEAARRSAPPPPPSGSSLLALPPPPTPETLPPPPKADDPRIEPGELLLLSPHMDHARALAQNAQQLGLRLKRRRNLPGLDMVISTFALPPDLPLPEALEALRRHLPPGQRWQIAPNHRYHPLGSERKHHYPRHLIDWPDALPCTHGARIGLVDTAIDRRHPSLRGADIHSRRFVTHGLEPAPADHGTAIAALLLGRGSEIRGLVPQARLYAATVFRLRRNRPETTTEWLLTALDWLARQRVQVINLSLGGPHNPLLAAVLTRLHRRGIALVAAAGNGGRRAPPVHPAAHPHVIAVTAVDARRRLWRRANRGDYIDLAAPGVDIWTAGADGRHIYRSGTSYAAPFVAAALLAAPLAELKKHALDLAPPGRDPRHGWGLLQAPRCP